MTSRQDFLRRYVAFTDDFRALDSILPRDAVLYDVDSRMPSEYAPRPVILDLADWDRKRPVYRFAVEPFDASAETLSCPEEIYRNPSAITVTFRTPNRKPERGDLSVKRCLLP